MSQERRVSRQAIQNRSPAANRPPSIDWRLARYFATIAPTHRQILCHVSWHVKQMPRGMLASIACCHVHIHRSMTVA